MTRGSLPDAVPIFPLAGALLLPFGQLPLNIFEPRYVALIEDVLGQDRLMGMVQPKQADSETVADDGAIFSTGCLGRITEFTDPGDGRYEIVLTGICRFAVTHELPMSRGYRRVAADFDSFVDDLDPEQVEIANRPGLLAALRVFFDHHELEADWQALGEVSDLVLVTTVAMGCPLKAPEKQMLLEAETLPERAERLQAILEMGLHAGDGSTARH